MTHAAQQLLSPTTSAGMPLTDSEQKHFVEHGYHILPSFIGAELREKLKAEVDEFLSDQAAPLDPYGPAGNIRKLQLEYPEHGLLLTEPRLMGLISQLMSNTEFSFHHLHTAKHTAGFPAANWHHDYEQYPQSNRSHLMLHVFFYLNGLDGTIGDLLLLPGTQKRILARDALEFCGTETLPGTVVIDDVPPGTAIIVNSAVVHARRSKPGGEGHPRYFIDSSYCQAGVKWPSYSTLHPRLMRRAKELGLGRAGAYDFVFNADNFFEEAPARAQLQALNVGSLILQLPGQREVG